MAFGREHRRLLTLSFSLALACAHAHGQTAFPTFEQQADQAKIRQLQHDIDMARIQAQTDSIRVQTELIRLQTERYATERANQPREPSLAEILGERRAKEEAEEAAAQVVADRKQEAALDAAKSADTVYLSLALAFPLAFGYLIVRRAKTAGGAMKYEEKFGVMLMIGALLLSLLALSISENWVPRLDAIQNLMLTLKIRFFPESESPYASAMVDVYTKHVLLSLVTIAAYGFTTYLGITPAWRKGEAALDVSVDPHKEV